MTIHARRKRRNRLRLGSRSTNIWSLTNKIARLRTAVQFLEQNDSFYFRQRKQKCVFREKTAFLPWYQMYFSPMFSPWLRKYMLETHWIVDEIISQFCIFFCSVYLSSEKFLYELAKGALLKWKDGIYTRICFRLNFLHLKGDWKLVSIAVEAFSKMILPLSFHASNRSVFQVMQHRYHPINMRW